MEKYLVKSFQAFFNKRKQLGYISDLKLQSLIVLNFIYRLVYFDYRGKLNEKDYNIIEKAINCLTGSNCLLPYRDYLKMGKLKVGEYTELAHKLCKLGTEQKEELAGKIESDMSSIKEELDEIRNANVVRHYSDDTIQQIDDIIIN